MIADGSIRISRSEIATLVVDPSAAISVAEPLGPALDVPPLFANATDPANTTTPIIVPAAAGVASQARHRVVRTNSKDVAVPATNASNAITFVIPPARHASSKDNASPPTTRTIKDRCKSASGT